VSPISIRFWAGSVTPAMRAIERCFETVQPG
jgi:hypothetical protein